MRNLIFRMFKDLLANQRKFVFGLSCLLVLEALSSLGQPSSLSPQLMASQQQIKWIKGPAKADLGTVAEVDIPEGYRFADAAGARVFYRQNAMIFGQLPMPSGLLGVLIPESGAWTAILEFTNIGYINPSKYKQINADAIIKATQAKIEDQYKLNPRGGKQILSLKWSLTPEFETANDSLNYGVEIELADGKRYQPYVQIFGRNGVLGVTVPRQVGKPAPDTVAIKEISKTISFKSGQRSGDYQEGDKLASVDMFQYVYQSLSGDEQPIVVPEKGWMAFFREKKKILWWENSNAAWLFMCLGVCVFVLVIYLISKEIRSISPNRAFPATDAKALALKGKKMRPLEAGSRRQRAFDYQKFYSDMMMQVSTRSYTGILLKPEEAVAEDAAETAPAASSDVVAEAKGAASELIARQKDFIEEQRRLMQQQTKLIEERSKLIEEKNQLLAKQSEMMENHLL